MKVLFDVDHGFAWARGGVQVLTENLMRSLQEEGIEVEPMRWWDSGQRGDILHLLYPPTGVLLHARRSGLRIVANILLDYLSSDGALELRMKQIFIRLFSRIYGTSAYQLGWRYPELCDAYIYPSQHELEIGKRLFRADLRNSHVILHGVADRYLRPSPPMNRTGTYLLSVGTIQERKNSLLLARAAQQTQVPVVFLGKAYASKAYLEEFFALVDGKTVIHYQDADENEKEHYLRNARGFVLLSRGESGCIAALEALATNTPVFLADLAWARSIYDGYVEFGNVRDENVLCRQLRAFYDRPPVIARRFPIAGWKEVGARYAEVYRRVLG